jgi:hypothetical protein
MRGWLLAATLALGPAHCYRHHAGRARTAVPGGPAAVRSHFRVSRAALTASGAAVYDETGALVAGGAGDYERDLREHAAAG